MDNAETEERNWWKKQNVWVGVVAPITTGVFVAAVIMLANGDFKIGALLAVAGVGGSAMTAHLIMHEPSVAQGRTAFFVVLSLVVLTWGFLEMSVRLLDLSSGSIVI
jgi:hypothetical protein